MVARWWKRWVRREEGESRGERNGTEQGCSSVQQAGIAAGAPFCCSCISIQGYMHHPPHPSDHDGDGDDDDDDDWMPMHVADDEELASLVEKPREILALALALVLVHALPVADYVSQSDAVTAGGGCPRDTAARHHTQPFSTTTDQRRPWRSSRAAELLAPPSTETLVHLPSERHRRDRLRLAYRFPSHVFALQSRILVHLSVPR